MTPPDRRDVGRAAKLLAKAESTDSHEEAVSLALRAYSLVAGWLNACEGSLPSPRRRERRLLRDRRSLWRTWRSHGIFGTSPSAPSQPYASQQPNPGSSRIDLRA